MTDQERSMAKALGQCSFLPGTFDKRYAGVFAFEAKRDQPEITEKEAELLRRMTYRYRRQIDPAIVALSQIPGPSIASTPAPAAADDLFKPLVES